MIKRLDRDNAASGSRDDRVEPHDQVDAAGGPPGEKPKLKGFDSQADLRRRWVAACAANRREVERVGILKAPVMDFAPFTELRCGARGKRTGKPCPQKGLYANGRCRWHGGLSTGPRTEEGKTRAAQNAPWRRHPNAGDEVEARGRGKSAVRSLPGARATTRELEPRDPPAISPRSPGLTPTSTPGARAPKPLLFAIRELLESDRSRSRKVGEIARRLGAEETAVRSGLRLLQTLRKIVGTRPDASGVPTLWMAVPAGARAPGEAAAQGRPPSQQCLRPARR